MILNRYDAVVVHRNGDQLLISIDDACIDFGDCVVIEIPFLAKKDQRIKLKIDQNAKRQIIIIEKMANSHSNEMEVDKLVGISINW